MEDGKCLLCPEYYEIHPDDNKRCQLKTCTIRQKVLKNAVCEPCLEYERAQDDGKDCGSDICNDR